MRRLLCIGMLAVCTGTAGAQTGKVKWQRADPPPRQEARVFHSTNAINLPTATTYDRGLFQFEISHRFVPPFSGGFDDLYGLDGPVNIRIGLGYALTDHLAVTLARSNYRDNLDLQVKYGSLRLNTGRLPLHLGIVAGGAWNTDYPGRSDGDSRNFQAYVQAPLNIGIARKVALGIVPSYLYNSILESDETEHALTLGLHGQYYLTRIMSLLVEWNLTEAGFYYRRDVAAFGIELETGGHFFTISAGNSTSLNPSQYLIGSNDRFEPDEWRLGFNITRLLHF